MRHPSQTAFFKSENLASAALNSGLVSDVVHCHVILDCNIYSLFLNLESLVPYLGVGPRQPSAVLGSAW